MSDLEVNEIKARIDLAIRNKARAEADRESARKTADAALQKLQEDYGVSTVEEAKARMLEMQTELQDLIAQTRQSLNDVNA